MEMLMTMLLVLVVYASAVDGGNKTAPMVAPLIIGLTVAAAHLVLMPYTGRVQGDVLVIIYDLLRYEHQPRP